MIVGYALTFLLFTSLFVGISGGTCDDQTCTKCLSNPDFQSSTFIISEPGKYCFSEDIVFDPTADISSEQAILIRTDNVEIDLKQFTLSQSESNVYKNRLFALITIQSDPNPANNIYIHDGSLERSSMFGIVANNANSISLENLRISDFEIGGLMFSHNHDLQITNVVVGPSSTNVKASGYYLSAQLTKKALELIELTDTDIIFSGNRVESLQTIYDNLESSLDLAYDMFLSDDITSLSNHPMYNHSVNLFQNPSEYPDYTLLRGIELNDVWNAHIENVVIRELKLNANEIPGAYFGDANETEDILHGVNGDVIDLRRMVSYQNAWSMDLDDPLVNIPYLGNPLSDAQVALIMQINDTNITESYATFLLWALQSDMEYLPSNTMFECKGDLLGNEKTGAVALSIMATSHNTKIENLIVQKITNKSPIPPYPCHNADFESKSTDVKGVSVLDSHVIYEGFNNAIEKLISYSGDVVGIHLEGDNSIVEFDTIFEVQSSVRISELCSGHDITFALLAEMMVDEQYPRNNQFYACNIKIDNDNGQSLLPNPPNGVNRLFCAQNIPNDLQGLIGDVLPVEFVSDEIEIESTSVETSSSSTTETPSSGEVVNADQPIVIKHDHDFGSYGSVIAHRKNNDIYSNRPYLHLALTIFGLICVVCTVFLFCMRFYNSYQKKKEANGYRKNVYTAKGKSYSDDSDDDTDQEIISP